MTTEEQTIDPREVEIVWKHDDNGRVSWVSVYKRGNTPPGIFAECNAGCAYSDWMTGAEASLTPEGIYISLELIGFASPVVRAKALHQFGKIAGYGAWTTMAVAVEEHLDG